MSNSTSYMIPKQAVDSSILLDTWNDLSQFKTQTKYGSLFESKKWTDKIQTYNKKVEESNEFIAKCIGKIE